MENCFEIERDCMRVLYGTTNQAKLESMKQMTKSLGLEIIGLSDLNQLLQCLSFPATAVCILMN